MFNQKNNKENAGHSFSFATSYHNRSSKDFFCYRSLEGDYGTTTVLDYESMNNVSLCKKPNCKHNNDDCVIKRLNGNEPMFGEEYIYYFHVQLGLNLIC